MRKEELIKQLLGSKEYEVVQVGKHQVFKEKNIYVVERFEYKENGIEMFSTHDGYTDANKAIEVAIYLGGKIDRFKTDFFARYLTNEIHKHEELLEKAIKTGVQKHIDNNELIVRKLREVEHQFLECTD